AELSKYNIKHIKIPLFSAFIGAMWERMIKVVKSCMYKVIGRSKLTYFELLTNLSNIQNAINSRPLTYVSNSDNLQPITPNSFLKLHCNTSLILKEEYDDSWVDSHSQNRVEQTLEQNEKILENFRKLWFESYLLSLREHSRDLYQISWENKIKVGDVVLIRSPVKPRPFWLLGKVLEVVIGYDNKIRSVKLRQGNGQIAYHSIVNLYPLELSITHSDNAPSDDNSLNNDISNINPIKDQDNSTTVVTKPKREAAEKFRKFIKDYSEHFDE
ncbi:hypothetical protein DMUE_5647, partial [Dictyocoela muelleri]